MKKSVVAVVVIVVLIIAGVTGVLFMQERRRSRVSELELRAERALLAADFSQAMQFARELENEEPLHARAQIVVTRAQLGLGHVSDAAVAWKVAHERDPKSAEAAEGLGHVTALQGDVTNARILLERAVELDPSRVTAVGRLAQLDVLQGDVAGSVRRLVELRKHRNGERWGK